MARSNLELQIARSPVLRYGLAVLSVSVALGGVASPGALPLPRRGRSVVLVGHCRNRLVCRDRASNTRPCSLRPRRHGCTHLPSNILLILVPLMPNLSLAVLVLLVRFSVPI